MSGDYIVSVMLGFGRNAQYLMTDTMYYSVACRFAEDLLQDAEEGRFVKVGNTYANPRNITTIRVVRARDQPQDYRGVVQ